MKNLYLFAAMAMVAGAASAQYNINAEMSAVTEKGKVAAVQYIQLDEASVNAFTAQGAKIESWAPDNADRNLWVWDETFVAGDASNPGVGMHFDGYVSLNVNDKGWSGAGFNIVGAGANSTTWNQDTRFHIAYMSNGTACPSVAFIIADGEKDCGSKPAKVAVGTAFNDNGAIYPSVGAAPKDDWQGLDISFADLKKMWPTFDFKAIDAWKGNALAFLTGGVKGQNISLDAIYFYNYATDGIGAVEAADAQWVVTRNTINVNGMAGIELYDLTGKLVKSTDGCTLGIDKLAQGLYVARCGNAARKIVVR